MRSIKARIDISAAPDRAFDALIAPSAICAWWGAARAVVMAEEGGAWCAAWGPDQDHPEYIAVATLAIFEPPRRLELADYRYAASAGPLPFKANFRTSFDLTPVDDGVHLEVCQAGFPSGDDATEASEQFYAACVAGWEQTLTALKKYLEAA